MTLLNTGKYRDELVSVVRETVRYLDIASAFITAKGLAAILIHLKPTVKVRVLSRWRLSDLIGGASDLEVYPALRHLGIGFHVNQDLHAKTVLSDRQIIVLGSANLTSRGLHLENSDGNIELGVRILAVDEDVVEMDRLFASSVKMTDVLFEEICASVDAFGGAPALTEPEYSTTVKALWQPSVTGLWVRDLFWSSEPNNISSAQVDSLHDAELLGVLPDQGRSSIDIDHFRSLSSVVWLIQELTENGGELYFGSITNRLHHVLLEDPKPYRKDVKALTINLLTWCALTLPETFHIDVPHFSQRIRLTSATRAYWSEEYWIDKMLNLRQDHDPTTWSKQTLFASPHKPIFLLALLRTVFNKGNESSIFELSLELISEFNSLWKVASDRQGDPFLPFVHLSSDGVWTLFKNDHGKLTAMEARSLGIRERQSIRANIDDRLLSCLGNAGFRGQLMDVITRRYFDAATADLLSMRE